MMNLLRALAALVLLAAAAPATAQGPTDAIRQAADARAQLQAAQNSIDALSETLKRLPVATASYNQPFTFAGQAYLAHCGAANPVKLLADGGLELSAVGGQNAAAFDTPNKIRCEGMSVRRTRPGELVQARALLTFEPIGDVSIFHPNTGWLIIWQQHAADSRTAAGAVVPASPPVAVILVPESGRYFVRVSKREPFLGIPTSFTREIISGRVEVFPGKPFRLEVRVRNPHGAAGGEIEVTVDGQVVESFKGAFGYDFPDRLKSVLYGGRAQEDGDYEKGFGIYAGRYTGAVPPTAGVRLTVRPLP